MGAFFLGLVLTCALASVVSLVNGDNDQRLLKLQVSQAAADLAGDLPAIQARLEADYQVAVATKANAKTFESFAADQVGADASFASVSLWQLGGVPRRLAFVGVLPELAMLPGGPSAVFARVHPSQSLSIISLLDAQQPRLGYAEMPPASAPANLVVYASGVLPKGKRLVVPKSSPFADLNFALYLGSSASGSNLLESSEAAMPVTGRQASAVVPFGDTTIELVGSPVHTLGGYLAENLTWMVTLAGVAISLAVAFSAERLVRSRMRAEVLAAENRRLYAEQREVAETLQQSLLPTQLPVFDGVDIAVRYVPGVSGLEIGGDWYDLISVDQDHFVFVVGDVSGRGLAAATTMASLRYSIRAYVAEGHPPETVLDKLGELLSVARDGQFATVLCGRVDVARRCITLANAGHLPALMITDEGASFIERPAGPPVGAPGCALRESSEVGVPPGATVLAVTDGLVERRGESIEEGLQRLRLAAAVRDSSLEANLDRVLEALVPGGSPDDIAVLGIRWQR
ncbi:MAG: PP2C family protein-serine/threonine phosphatase [Acidimicrobiales bacterium]